MNAANYSLQIHALVGCVSTEIVRVIGTRMPGCVADIGAEGLPFVVLPWLSPPSCQQYSVCPLPTILVFPCGERAPVVPDLYVSGVGFVL